jgi:hypothetical protein
VKNRDTINPIRVDKARKKQKTHNNGAMKKSDVVFDSVNSVQHCGDTLC